MKIPRSATDAVRIPAIPDRTPGSVVQKLKKPPPSPPLFNVFYLRPAVDCGIAPSYCRRLVWGAPL
jgi:hypothetical protein